MSNALCSDRTSGRKPARKTCFSSPWCLICCSSVGAQLPFAGDHEPRVRHLAHDERRRLDQVPLALVRHQRGDVADDRRAVRQPELLVQLRGRRPRRRARDRCLRWTVTARARRTPSATQHLADRLRRADEAVHLVGTSSARARCPSGGSRRAAPRPAARFGCVLIDSASAAIATPCGSCAWTMSGRSCLMARDRRQAAERSISVRGASGSSSSPSSARRRSSPSACATSIARWPAARRPSTVTSTWFCPPRQVRAVSMCSENISAAGARRGGVRWRSHSFASFRNT